MYKELSRGLRNVEVVFEEALDSEEGLLVEALDAAALEYLLEEHFAEGRRKLIDKTGDAEVIIAYDSALGVEYLGDLKGRLCFLEGTRQILDASNGGADTDNAVGVEFAGEGVRDGACELLEVAALGVRLNLLDKRDFLLVDIDNEVLGLVGEEVLYDIVSGNVCLGYDLDQQAYARNLGVEVKLSCLEVDISGENVVENDVLDEVRTVVLLIIVLLDARERNAEQLSVLLRVLVSTLNENGVVILGAAAKGFVGVP